jgi:hypothetical protein
MTDPGAAAGGEGDVAGLVLLASRLPASFGWEPRGSLRLMLRPRV